jgi:ABC-type sugar transport system ATPase subunit
VTATVAEPVEKGRVVLHARGLRKTYGYITAVDGVDLDLRAGEIVAIVGDNGAGKSTLIKMLCGATQPDSGELYLEGRDGHQTLGTPHAARALGIETVFQDLALAPNRDVVHNLFLGREVYYGGIAQPMRILNMRAMRRRAAVQLAALDINIPRIAGVPVGHMSGGQRQSVAIARAAFWASRVLLMDEPTAALGVRESGAVLRLARRVADAGVAVVMVSHVLPHVMELADRVVVMRGGNKVAELVEGIEQDRLIALIVGGERRAFELQQQAQEYRRQQEEGERS